MKTRDIVRRSTVGRSGVFLDAFDVIDDLTDREQGILNAWICGFTQREIADWLGVSQPYISQSLQKIGNIFTRKL